MARSISRVKSTLSKQTSQNILMSPHPAHLRQHTQCARHAKQHGVKVGLPDAEVLKQHAAVRVDVGPGVLDLRGTCK
jgi:hypothetical protein